MVCDWLRVHATRSSASWYLALAFSKSDYDESVHIRMEEYSSQTNIVEYVNDMLIVDQRSVSCVRLLITSRYRYSYVLRIR